MAFEDSHTFFVVKWLREIGLENMLDLWYDYHHKKYLEKKKHRDRKVYSRIYEFVVDLIEKFPEKEEEMVNAYDQLLAESEIEEKMEFEIGD